MHKSSFVLLLLALAGLIAPARSDSAPAGSAPTLPLDLDLPTALRMADAINPDLSRSRERINERKAALKVTHSSMLPDLTAFGLYQLEDDGRTGSFGGDNPPDDEQWRAGVELLQPLYSGGILCASDRARRHELQAVRDDVITTRARILSNVYRAYYDALLAREVVKVQEESLDLIKRQLDIARNRFDAGAGPKFDVLQAEVRVANARPPLIRAVNDFRTAIETLRTSIGAIYPDGPGPTNVVLSGSWDTTPSLGDLDTAVETALQNRSELRSLQQLRDAALETVKRNRGERAPKIDLFANYAVENVRYSADDDTLDGWQAGVKATLSIWEGGKVSGQIAQAQSVYDQLAYQVETRRLDIELEVRNAWNDAEEAREILDAATLVITQAEEALRLAQNRYSVGALTQLDVLTSELELRNARLEQITAARNFQLAAIDFSRAVGSVPGKEYVGEEPTEEQP